ncbi:hypothetical protein N7527_008122 [Penicillium freii]|uniref:Uncharacterized protein n=1 Tax=Penicillium freii TaxID=48697 RepID=A0A101MB74_PENFR|nr:hypothetical protein N7527_008122 [Penicillium freii]KUM57327.1 hypothetical protein ACN42_g9864 [Penicillium freii]
MQGMNSSNERFAICRNEVLLLQNLDVGFHETKIVANRGTSLIRLSHEQAVNGGPANIGPQHHGNPRMISPNHQPILNDAGRAMDNDFHQDKKKNKV